MIIISIRQLVAFKKCLGIGKRKEKLGVLIDSV